MMSGRLCRLIVLVIGIALLNAVLVSGEIATYHECTKVSDTELRVDLICQHFDGYYYQYYFSDGTTSLRMYNEFSIQHTFSDVSVDSFPLSIHVYVFDSAQTSEIWDVTAVTIECSELFAPEISVVAGGATIPNGGTHNVAGEQAPGTLQMAYTVDNTAGVGDLIVDGATVASLTNCSGFTVDTSLPLTVGDGETGTLRVSIMLDDPGAFGFDLNISSNDPDTDPYSFDVSGTVMTPEQAALGGATRQLVPMGSGGAGVFLDCLPVLDEAGDSVMAGFLPLAGVYEVGETVTGAAMVCDPAMNPLRSSWIHVFAYSVDLSLRPERLSLIDHWVVRYDHELECYAVEWSTNEMSAGFYDIHLAIGDGRSETLRIQLIEPGAEH